MPPFLPYALFDETQRSMSHSFEGHSKWLAKSDSVRVIEMLDKRLREVRNVSKWVDLDDLNTRHPEEVYSLEHGAEYQELVP